MNLFLDVIFARQLLLREISLRLEVHKRGKQMDIFDMKSISEGVLASGVEEKNKYINK